ncbi:MAG: hypothetical protein DWQ36_23185 [Acidobacteria bacterium]|nr:MAG: hypothetical protein DWQ30_25540 [Acidobacteriota bacterium]REK00394.1 MAG: hypothetical protein DWQ36_23185 [Acidobacteriota bacterium]
MSDHLRLPARARRCEDGLELLSPGVGWLELTVEVGDLVAPGQTLGRLRQLRSATEVVAPEGAAGRVRGPLAATRADAVSHGDNILSLAPLDPGSGGDAALGGEAAAESSGPAVLAPQSGRFYQRPSPQDDPFVTAGTLLQPGDPVGLLEVMKTFAPVRYPRSETAPARVVRYLQPDGADVSKGTPLVELEPE